MYVKLFCAFAIISCVLAIKEDPDNSKYWTTKSNKFLTDKLRLSSQLNEKPAKNVILFLGDGMGPTVNTAGRIYTGQTDGSDSDQDNLAWENFPHGGLVKTYSNDFHVTDSAASATAYLSGVKAHQNTLGLNSDGTRGDCLKSLKSQRSSVAAWAQERGMATGIVTTTRITHATPAALYANTAERNWESGIPVDVINGTLCKDVATQFIENEVAQKLNVVFGGGAKMFNSSRVDGRNLVDEWQNMRPNGQLLRTKDDLQSLNIENYSDQIFGLFHENNMEYSLLDKNQTQPSLTEMTEIAVKLLQEREEDGFFLLVEGGRIDHAMHANLAKIGLEEVRQMHQAVARTLELVDTDETLIIVTADHSSALSMIGYAARNQKLTEKIEWVEHGDDKPSITDGPVPSLIFASGPGAALYKKNLTDSSSRTNLTDVDTDADDFISPAFLPTDWGATHGGEDVGIWAIGPYSHLLTGTIDNTHIARTMAFVMCANENEYAVNACNVEDHSDNTGSRTKKIELLLAIMIGTSVIIIILLVLLLVRSCLSK